MNNNNININAWMLKLKFLNLLHNNNTSAAIKRLVDKHLSHFFTVKHGLKRPVFLYSINPYSPFLVRIIKDNEWSVCVGEWTLALRWEREAYTHQSKRAP